MVVFSLAMTMVFQVFLLVLRAHSFCSVFFWSRIGTSWQRVQESGGAHILLSGMHCDNWRC